MKSELYVLTMIIGNPSSSGDFLLRKKFSTFPGIKRKILIKYKSDKTIIRSTCLFKESEKEISSSLRDVLFTDNDNSENDLRLIPVVYKKPGLKTSLLQIKGN